MRKISILNKLHDRKNFDCGQNDINNYLKLQANQGAKKRYSQTHVLYDDEIPTQIIGFYTLASCFIDKSLKHDISIKYPHNLSGVNLVRMGVDLKFQERQLSEDLIYSAIIKTCEIESIMGVPGLFLDAKSDELISYYIKYGFELIQNSKRKMWLSIQTCKDLTG